MKTLQKIIFATNLIFYLSLTGCGAEPIKKDNLAANPFCDQPDPRDQEEMLANWYRAGCEADYAPAIKALTVNGSNYYTFFEITYKDLGNGTKRYGHIYQTIQDYDTPYAPYYAYLPSSDFEFGNTWNVYEGKRPKLPNITNQYDRYSEVLKYKNVKRINLPIDVQEVINMKLGLKQEKINTKDLIIGLNVKPTEKQMLTNIAYSKAESEQSERNIKKYNADVHAIESKDHQKALAILGTGIAMIADTNIERKRMKQQKKAAAQKSQIQAQQAQRDYSNQKLAEYDRQYVKHDSTGSQNQSSGNYGASSDNSNSSNTNHQSRPHKERVNLPEQSGCISMGESNKRDATADTRWFLLKNSCAYPVKVRWCAGQGCVNSSSAADISGGGTDESWAIKDRDGRVHLNLMACQESSGNDEVYMDWPTKQCWTNVEMQ